MFGPGLSRYEPAGALVALAEGVQARMIAMLNPAISKNSLDGTQSVELLRRSLTFEAVDAPAKDAALLV